MTSMIEQILTADVDVTITAPVTKLCPVKDETDHGTVTLTYRTHGNGLELHAVAAYLDTFTTRHLSHEDFTAEVANATGCTVTSSWTTAGMTVTCSSLETP
jgi:NADPH-dependent 7-cyano-7-deazaguanine reductase QueF